MCIKLAFQVAAFWCVHGWLVRQHCKTAACSTQTGIRAPVCIQAAQPAASAILHIIICAWVNLQHTLGITISTTAVMHVEQLQKISAALFARLRQSRSM